MKWLSLLLVLAVAGCLGDGDGRGDRDVVPDGPPVYPLPDPVTGMEFVVNPDAGGAAGIWVEAGYAYLSGTDGLRIVDVQDPANATVIARDVPETERSRDVDVLHHPNGRTYAVLAHGGAKVSLTDVTEPNEPTPVSVVTDINAAHNIAVVPDTTLVYVSHSILVGAPPPGQSGKIDIIDFADPAAPTVTPFRFPLVATEAAGGPKPVGATTCHDITFEAALSRAYCAGVSETHVWDISDPMAPVIAQVVAWPGNQIHHGAWGVRNGSLLIVGDEIAGAAGPVPACGAAANPYAALWFIDISDLAAPVPVGYFQVEHEPSPTAPALCTTHFGTPVADRDLFVMGWYTAGTVLIDFADPRMPSQVAGFRAEGPTNTWEARYWNGHVFTGDRARGIDILRLT